MALVVLLHAFGDVYRNQITNAITNESYICLIPMKVGSLNVGDYRPISLVLAFAKFGSKVGALMFNTVYEKAYDHVSEITFILKC